jgi:hypothetical protein
MEIASPNYEPSISPLSSDVQRLIPVKSLKSIIASEDSDEVFMRKFFSQNTKTISSIVSLMAENTPYFTKCLVYDSFTIGLRAYKNEFGEYSGKLNSSSLRSRFDLINALLKLS